MAEPLSTTEIAPSAQPTIQPVHQAFGVAVEPHTPENGYTISIRRFSASGDAKPLVVHIPENASLASIRQNPLLLAAVLKDGDPVWQQCEPGFILVAVLHANSLGLDILQGDIYPIEGRMAVSDKAKIKYALNAGIFSDAPEIITVEGPAVAIPWETRRGKGTYTGPNLTTTVKLHVRGWALPVVYTAELRAWFRGANPNWMSNPKGMLELRAYAKACERVCPVGTQPDEAPPLASLGLVMESQGVESQVMESQAKV
jgi:hypothetical protein